jgi:hypothetical protein
LHGARNGQVYETELLRREAFHATSISADREFARRLSREVYGKQAACHNRRAKSVAGAMPVNDVDLAREA